MASGASVRLLALDAGTSCVKAVVARLPQGDLEAEAVGPLDPPAPAPGGGAEQCAARWWEAAASAVRALGGAAADVGAIALSGQMQSVLLVAADGRPLRPALIYSDARAAEEAAALEAKIGRDRLVSETTNWKGAVSVLPKLCWLHRHEPAMLEAAAHVLFGAHDYLFFRLTGVATTDLTNASVTGLLRSDKDDWAAELLAEAGLPGGLLAKLPVLARGGPAAAPLLPAAAEALGQPALGGVAVCHGAGDFGTTTVGALGLGGAGAYCYLGTSGWVAAQMPPARAEEHAGRAFCVRAPTAERSVVLAAPTTTAGGNLRWLISVMWPELPEAEAYAALEAEAAAAPAGSGGVLYLPYLGGERCPVSDPAARACFVGMGAGTTRGHMCRAALEGLCYAVRSLLELLPTDEGQAPAAAASGAAPGPLVLVGGAAASATLVQALADVLQREVRVPRSPQHAPALGAARLALPAALPGAVAAGACDAAPAPARTATPREAHRDVYERGYAAFCGLHPALRETFARPRD